VTYLVHLWRLKCNSRAGKLFISRYLARGWAAPKEIMMKTALCSLLVLCWLALAVSNVQAELLYLPMIGNPTPPGASDPNVDFALDHVRLWEIGENGGQPGSPVDCGNRHTLEVHVFASQGDQGDSSRLDGVLIQVLQVRGGERWLEYYITGGAGRGKASIPLYDGAEVRIFADVDGHPVRSHTASVTTMSEAISPDLLYANRYCASIASCEAFINQNRCRGMFSWNVVFKRTHE
jgi:hypothetical protein